jgi:hypothetical protein
VVPSSVRRAVLVTVAVVALAPACGGGATAPTIDAAPDAISPACLAAETHQDLPWIEANVFATSCATATCHDGTAVSPATKIDLHPGKSRASLLGVTSILEPTRTLVVAGDPTSSYLMVMLGSVPGPISFEIGTMPMNGYLLCLPKRDAIARWIAAGAAAN